MVLLKHLLTKLNLPPQNIRYFHLGIILFLTYICFSVIISLDFFDSFDPKVTQFLQTVTPRFLDIPLSFFSVLGSAEITSIILIFILILIYNKKRQIPISFGLFGLVVIFELIGKYLIVHPGPPNYFLRYALPFSTPAHILTSFSFPSGHVSRTIFIVIIMSILAIRSIPNIILKSAVLSILIVFSIIMVSSRIYLGEHWISDTIGGFFLGSALGFFAMVYLNLKK